MLEQTAATTAAAETADAAEISTLTTDADINPSVLIETETEAEIEAQATNRRAMSCACPPLRVRSTCFCT